MPSALSNVLTMSPSHPRAWIEIIIRRLLLYRKVVALHPEGAWIEIVLVQA